MLTEKPPLFARKTHRLPPGKRIEGMLVIRLGAHGLDEARFLFTLPPRGPRLSPTVLFPSTYFVCFVFVLVCVSEGEVFFFFSFLFFCFFLSSFMFFSGCFLFCCCLFCFLWEFEQGASC